MQTGVVALILTAVSAVVITFVAMSLYPRLRNRVRELRWNQTMSREEQALKGVVEQIRATATMFAVFDISLPPEVLSEYEQERKRPLRPGEASQFMYAACAIGASACLSEQASRRLHLLLQDVDATVPTIVQLRRVLKELQQLRQQRAGSVERSSVVALILDEMAAGGAELLRSTELLDDVPVLAAGAPQGLSAADAELARSWGIPDGDLDVLDQLLVNLQSVAWAAVAVELGGKSVLTGVSQQRGLVLHDVVPEDLEQWLLVGGASQLWNSVPDGGAMRLPREVERLLWPIASDVGLVAGALDAEVGLRRRKGRATGSGSISVVRAALAEFSGAAIRRGSIAVALDSSSGIVGEDLDDGEVVAIPVSIEVEGLVTLGRLEARAQGQRARLHLDIPVLHQSERQAGDPATAFIEQGVLEVIRRELLHPADVVHA